MSLRTLTSGLVNTGNTEHNPVAVCCGAGCCGGKGSDVDGFLK